MNLYKIIQLLPPIQYWIEYWLIKRSGLFDADFYRLNYQKEQANNIHPIMHYVITGWHKGHNPSPEFNTDFYVKRNPDVKDKEINPLVHYIRWGHKEGRAPQKSTEIMNPCYQVWIKKYDTISAQDRKIIFNKITGLKKQPRICLVMIVKHPESKCWVDAIKTLQAQYYQYWTVAVFFETSSFPKASPLIPSAFSTDQRIIFHTLKPEDGLSEILNKIPAENKGAYLGIVHPEDMLRAHALYIMAEEIINHPNKALFYCDHDYLDKNGGRCHPYFKPDWNPDLFLSQNYLEHFCLFKTEQLSRVSENINPFDELWTWDLNMQMTDLLPPEDIHHIPAILCHVNCSQKEKTEKEANSLSSLNYKNILLDYINKQGKNAKTIQALNGSHRIKYNLPESQPLFSVIIPTKNRLDLLKKCIESIVKTSNSLNYEIFVVNNQSDDPNILSYFDELKKKEHHNVIDYDEPFNSSAINNFAVERVHGAILFFLNNDIEVISPNWMKEMAGYAIQPEIGAVGAMLYYPNDTIQHAGVILGLGGIAGHAYLHEIRGFRGQEGRAKKVQNYSAVTGACLAIEKKKFCEVGGFDEENFPVTYNDIDLCVRLLDAGYRNLWTPYAELYHHESASRKILKPSIKNPLRIKETQRMMTSWGQYLVSDPAYNPNLSLDAPSFSLAFPPRTTKPWEVKD